MWESMSGTLMLEITSADVPGLLNILNREKIKLHAVNYCSDLVITVKLAQAHYNKLLEITEKHGASVKIQQKKGLCWTVMSLIKRPVLVTLAVFILLLSAFLSSRVFFIQVDGNKTIPVNLILESAEACGIRFGTSRRQIRSELVKNALLEKIPQLQWIGVNTQGCTAIISVREKTPAEQEHENKREVCSIVAARDGVIQNCTVYKGNPLCTVGQAVKAGQTLVSGYIDCGIVTKTTKADAEIRALTFRELTFVTPKATLEKERVVQQKTDYAIILGKKLIKLTKDSGNLGVTCGKIYEENYLQLPAGFTLPIALVKQTSYYYEEIKSTAASADTNKWLNSFAQAYLQKKMIAGEIISAQTEMIDSQDVYRLKGQYACVEMIGQIKYEQMLGTGDTNDRTNREF